MTSTTGDEARHCHVRALHLPLERPRVGHARRHRRRDRQLGRDALFADLLRDLHGADADAHTDPTPTPTPAPVSVSSVYGSGVFGSAGTLTATLTSGGNPLAGKSVAFKLNGSNVGNATTDQSGVATLAGVTLSGMGSGAHNAAVTAWFAGDSELRKLQRRGRTQRLGGGPVGLDDGRPQPGPRGLELQLQDDHQQHGQRPVGEHGAHGRTPVAGDIHGGHIDARHLLVCLCDAHRDLQRRRDTRGRQRRCKITVKPREEGTLNNTATVKASQWDPSTGNGSAYVNGLPAVKNIDVSVTQTDSADPINVGDNTVYTLVVKNGNGPIGATGVTLQDTLPSGMTFVSATTTQGSLVTPPVGSSGIVTANIGAMGPGATVTVTVTAKGAASGTWTNTAQVSSAETDTNTANNSATQSTTVKASAVVGLQKILLVKQTMTGGCESTTGQVYLTAPAPAGGATVSLSKNVSGVSVPAYVNVPAGATVSPAFNVNTNAVTAKQSGLVTATSGPNSVSRSVTINVGNGTCP